MANPNRLTIVPSDYLISVYYSANNTTKTLNFYNTSDGGESGNSTMKLAFANACSDSGFTPRSDYHAIQYSDGNGEIEYANGHPHTTFTGNTAISSFIPLIDQWYKQVLVEDAEELRLSQIMSWADVRGKRNSIIRSSDGIFIYATETGQTVPQEWKDYRQALRDITTTYSNTELIVWPTQPAWPDWGQGNTA